VLISGGKKITDEELMRRVRMSLEAGATGLVFGRNLWQRPFEKTLEIAAKIKELMKTF
jgi:class I fructose-bisphosphate aldolase